MSDSRSVSSRSATMQVEIPSPMGLSTVTSLLFLIISTATVCTNAEGLWIANQARYECDNDKDGSTARVVACVPSNQLGGKEYAIGESWLGSEYRYLCTKTYSMQLALQKIGCVTPLGEELQPGNMSTIPEKGQYKCVAKGTTNKHVFLEYNPGCFYNSRLYAPDETLRTGSSVLACKTNGGRFVVMAIACVWTNDSAIPVGDFVQIAPGQHSKCQMGEDSMTASFVPATGKEYQEWLVSIGHTTMTVPTTSTVQKTTTPLATIPIRTTQRYPKDCTDKHPLCHDLCTYPCFEEPQMGGSIFGHRPQRAAQWPGYEYVVVAPGQYQWVQQGYAPVANPWNVPGNGWNAPGNPPWNVPVPPWKPVITPANPWWQGQGKTTTRPTKTTTPPTTTYRPLPGLCHLWTILGKEGVEQMCPKSCQVIGCKYDYVGLID